jgi:hypothetical protein
VEETALNEGINPNALSLVAASMRAAVGDYAGLAQQLSGSNLVGLTMFGDVLDAAFDSASSSASSVMVLERADLNLLRRLAEYGPKLGGKHIAAPLVMTPDYIAGSLDTFPLELLEIEQRRATLIGRDCFADLEFSAEHVRLQCEREFKRVLIRLRQGLLAAAGSEAVLGDLRWDIGQHLLRTLTGLLWLKGKTEHRPRQQVLTESEKLIGEPLPGVRAAIFHRGEHDWVEFAALYNEVEKLAKVADEF